jgi:hypothetical protein
MKHVMLSTLDRIYLNALWLRIVRQFAVCVRKGVNIHHEKLIQYLGLL